METKTKTSKLSDEDLVSRIVKTNDTLLFEVLYDRYALMVFNKCLGFAKDHDEAKDLTQDVFLKLFVKLASFKGRSKFSTWLYAFTYNHCVNYVTRNKEKKIQKQSIEVKEIESISDTEETDYSIHQMKVEKLKSVLNLISPNEKMILLLKYQDYLSIKEIAEALDLGESAVKMRLKRAKEKLITVYTEKYANGESF
ncbi:sigma-70 family RNA polymerase sigma factor [Winogradskyella sp. 3972H.M.0a.05]|uniref:RNA polymerase sigma factor n=1 Tax=Winogradskyella sp. 3972H.M.0a.05 TaxID=2950277 RepID=UPI0033911CF0